MSKGELHIDMSIKVETLFRVVNDYDYCNDAISSSSYKYPSSSPREAVDYNSIDRMGTKPLYFKYPGLLRYNYALLINDYVINDIRETVRGRNWCADYCLLRNTFVSICF